MKEYRKYSIKQNRFKRSFLEGFEMQGEDTLVLDKNIYHRIFICGSIDGVEKGALWGRLHFDIEISEDMLFVVHIAATDDKMIKHFDKDIFLEDVLKDQNRSIEEKIDLMSQLDEIKLVNKNDLLLHELRGKYLYLLIEVRGLGVGVLKNMFVTNEVDILNEILPKVCQERESFYHRYLSVYSSIYMDFQEKVEEISKVLDIDTAPVNLLPLFAKWMGMEISIDFLPEEKLRTLVKESYKLNRIKGTREAISRICEIVLDEKPVILERNVIQNQMHQEEIITNNVLFDNENFDVIIVLSKRISDEQKKLLMFLINQLKPVRCRIKLKYIEKKDNSNIKSAIDINMKKNNITKFILDENIKIDNQNIIL